MPLNYRAAQELSWDAQHRKETAEAEEYLALFCMANHDLKPTLNDVVKEVMKRHPKSDPMHLHDLAKGLGVDRR